MLDKRVQELMKIGNLQNDTEFVRGNNHLTALAMAQILREKRGCKILIIGAGRLCEQLKGVLEKDFDITVQSVSKPKKSYHDYFEFPIVINTVPKRVTPAKMFSPKSTVYDLASSPYGIIGDTSNLRYEILGGLPGKYFPKESAKLLHDGILRNFSARQKPMENPTIKEGFPGGFPPPFEGGFSGVKNDPKTIVLCITGSACCYEKLLPIITELSHEYNIIPVISTNGNLSNRFVDMDEYRKKLAEICKKPVISTISGAERLSSMPEIVASLVLPATGNTIAKLAHAITDTPVTMAVKALLRNSKPCIIGLSTNDALSGNMCNIGTLLARKNYYFIPFAQDSPEKKPFSMVCKFEKTAETIKCALNACQIQPIIVQ